MKEESNFIPFPQNKFDIPTSTNIKVNTNLYVNSEKRMELISPSLNW